MTAVSAEAVENLTRQFAGRAQDQDAARFVLGGAWIGGEPMQDGQREGGGFAGSGLRDTDHIATRHDGRDGLRLDRRWGGVFLFDKRTRDGVVKLKVGKVGQRNSFLLCALPMPSRDAPRLALRENRTPRAIWAVDEVEKSEPEAI